MPCSSAPTRQVRFFYLYRFGGVYMDTDFTCLAPFEELPLLPGHAIFGYGAVPERMPDAVVRRCLSGVQ